MKRKLIFFGFTIDEDIHKMTGLSVEGVDQGRQHMSW